MLTKSEQWLPSITAPSRELMGWVDVYRDSTSIYTFNPEDKLVSAKVESATENGSLFGYVLCQKATIEILDENNDITIQKDDRLEVWLGVRYGEDSGEAAAKPSFYVETVTKNENNGNITIVAYDIINKTTKHKQRELEITYPITTIGYINLIGSFLGIGVKATSLINDISYTEEAPPNFSGEETLRDVLRAIAEITGTICYIDSEDDICFKSLGGSAVGEIDKELYFELKTGEPIEITQISRVNELGDTVSAGVDGGYHYAVRSNPFLEGNGTDIADMLFNLVNLFGGTIFRPYEIKWRGNPAFEIGDKITITQRDDTTVDIFYLGETLVYNGGMVATSSWQAPAQEEITVTPTIGEALTQTFAKVDKVNQQIVMVAGATEENATNIGQLVIDTEAISNSVSGLTTLVEEGQAATDASIKTLEEKVETTITKDDFTIEVKNIISDGIERVETATGYVFDEDGLNITKTGSDISTKITENGMTVSRNDEVVLSADHEGVKAEDLHATTFLIIGDYARFEEFEWQGETRIGCFWIG